MAHDIHQGMIARDDYVSPHGVIANTLVHGAVPPEAAVPTSNVMALANITQKRPISSTEVRDVKKSRSKSLQFICSIPDCWEKFNCREYLDTHMKLHLGVKPFICDVCGKVCQTESKLKAHEASHASDGVKPKCDICERSFSSQSAINKHKKILHKPKPHICPHCSSGFEERKYMVIHAKRAHSADLPVEVEESRLPSDNFQVNPSANNCKDLFKEDFSTQGSGNPLPLSTVPNHSDDLQKENDHSTLVSTVMQKKADPPSAIPIGVPINCEFCTSTFPSVAYLEQHMAVHLGEKPFTCHSCGICFLNRHDISNHMKLHTSETEGTNFVSTGFNNGSFNQFVPPPMPPGPTRGPQMFDKYVCVMCNEHFLNLGSLKRHQAKGHNTAMLSI